MSTETDNVSSAVGSAPITDDSPAASTSIDASIDAPIESSPLVDSVTPVASVDPVEPAAVSEKRVYVGNVPFKAHVDEIKQLFSDFNVESVSFPARRLPRDSGGFYIRRLGFAFVELASKEEAARAVEELDGKSLHERQLSVNLARARARAPTEEKATEATGGAATATAASGGAGSEGPKAKAGSRGSKSERAKAKAARALSQKYSSTTIVVSNLPVGTTEDEVKAIFQDLTPKDVRLVTRSEKKIINKKRGEIIRPAKLLAFVEFADEDSQKKAIDDYNGKKHGDIDLIIKIAVDLEKPLAVAKTATESQEEAKNDATTELDSEPQVDPDTSTPTSGSVPEPVPEPEEQAQAKSD